MAMKITMFLAAMAACYLGSTDSSNIAKVGNKILGSLSGVDVPGAIFLMDDDIMSDAVLFAFAAFFRSTKPIHFQVWRPGNSTNKFKLLADARMIPSTLSKESVYLQGLLLPCIRVQKGDRMGIYMEEAPGAVAYTFVTNSPKALGYTLPNVTVPTQIGEDVTFDSLTFPYDFSVAAYVDTNLTGYPANEPRPTCKPGLLIPDDVIPTLTPKTTTPVTGRPGATGATGPEGIRGIDGATGPKGEQGVRGLTGATGPVGPNGIQGLVGTNGSAGATGATGAQGPKGSDGTDGSDGTAGATGPAGPQGERGLPGPPGPAGGNRTIIQPTAAPVIMTSFFSNPSFIMGLMVWLIIVTLVIIVIIIVIAVIKSRANEPYRPRKPGRMTSLNDTPSWMDTMKEDYFKDYSNETINTKDDKPKLPEYTYENEVATSDILATSDISTQLTDTTTSGEEVKNY